MSERIADDPGMPNHAAEADFFSQLLIDLKKMLHFVNADRLLVVDGNPITLARLEEGTKHVFALGKCRDKSLFER